MAKMIRITAKRDGFRRAGIAHPATPTDHPADRFSDEEREALERDTMLIVQTVEVPDAEDEEAWAEDQKAEAEKLATYLKAEDLTGSGVPKTEAVTRILGRTVTATERDQLWQIAKNLPAAGK